MARASRKKRERRAGEGFSLFDDGQPEDIDANGELPKDQAGRQKIKKQYVDLLGIRAEKLRGRILNRERIDKEIEGIYFLCAACGEVCHNLDEGLVEDEDNTNNLCLPCHTAKSTPVKASKTASSRKTSRKKK